MKSKTGASLVASLLAVFTLLVGFMFGAGDPPKASEEQLFKNDRLITTHAQRMIEDGRRIVRFDLFGSDVLQLHKVIAGKKNGGVGGGVNPTMALSVGLKRRS